MPPPTDQRGVSRRWARVTRDVELLIVEQHAIMRHGLRSSFEQVSGIWVTDCVGSVVDAWASPALGEVDVLLLDIDTPNALDFVAEVREFVEVRVVVHGRSHEHEQLLRALSLGAASALDGDILTPESLVLSVRSAAHGGSLVLPTISAGGARELLHHHQLSEREQQVLALVAEGLPTREVAVELSYSERTVKKVLSDAVVKLGARSRSQAIARAVRQGLI